MPNFKHPDDSKVYICPECEHRCGLHKRQDNSVVCYDCGAEVPNRVHLHTREKIKGVSNRIDPPEREPIPEPGWEFSPGLDSDDREQLRERVATNLSRGPSPSD